MMVLEGTATGAVLREIEIIKDDIVTQYVKRMGPERLNNVEYAMQNSKLLYDFSTEQWVSLWPETDEMEATVVYLDEDSAGYWFYKLYGKSIKDFKF